LVSVCVVVAVTLAIPASMSAQGGPLPTTGSSAGIDLEPLVKLSDKGMSGIEMDYTFPQVEVSTVNVDGETYQYIHMEGFGELDEVGRPALPMRNHNIALPPDAEVRIEILESESKVYDGYLIHPALEPALDMAGATESRFTIDEKLYSLDQNYPETPVRVISINEFQGVSLALVQICPVQFNPSQKQLTVYSRLRFRVEFVDGGELEIGDQTLNSQALLKNIVVNDVIVDAAGKDDQSSEAMLVSYSQSGDQQPEDGGRSDIIIITHADYEEAASSLAEWKRMMGYDVEVISQTGWTTAQVKAAIESRYNEWYPKPDYFIIIGDHDNVPAKYSTLIYPHVTDLYYACMDGPSDYYPDMASGRISVSSAAEANAVIGKIIAYERNPSTDASFYASGAVCAQFQDDNLDGYADRRFSLTSEEIRDHLISNGYAIERIYFTESAVTPTKWNDGLYANGEPVPSDLLKPGFAWDGNNNDVLNSISDGGFLLLHRGHGYPNGSGWYRPHFTTNSVSALTNGNDIPVVFSVNCYTGKFDIAECFAEKFLRQGNGGAVGVIAASEATMSGYNDALSEGFIDAIWPGLVPSFPHNSDPEIASHDPIYAMGDVLNHGKIIMEETWGTQYGKYIFEVFHYFGDPSMRVWTAVPQTITLTHDAQLIYGQATFNISNTSCQTGVATLYYDGEIIGKGTLASGAVSIHLSSYLPSTEDTALLTITSHNYRPYQDDIAINIEGDYIILNDYQISDTIGNGDGLADSGESIALGVTLENVGVSDAANVSVVLTTSDPYTTITDDLQVWGAIDANATSVQSDAFSFDVANDVPDQHQVDLHLRVTASGETSSPWESAFSITINAPELTVGSVMIDDSAGNANGLLDPGETVYILVDTSNAGHSNAPQTAATLCCSSNHIMINTASYTLGTLPVGGSGTAYFSVTASGSIPNGTAVDFVYSVNSGSYSANLGFTQSVGCEPEVKVGNGTTPIKYPFDTYWMDSRTQSILLSDEILHSGIIQEISLYLSTRPGQDLSSFHIRMQHTSMDSFPSADFVNSDWTTVLNVTGIDVSQWDIPGWVEFQLSTPFLYDGTSNLLIDYCIDNSFWTSDGQSHSSTASNRTLTVHDDLPSGNLLNRATGTLRDWYNDVILGGCFIPVTPAPTPTPTSTFTPGIMFTSSSMYYGDATEDGAVDVSDYAQVRAILLGLPLIVPGADATMDGFVDVSDYAQVQAIILGCQTASEGFQYAYDFSSGEELDKWAKQKVISALPPALNLTFATDSGWTSLSQNGYFNISVEDGNTSILPGASANHSALQFRFTINEPVDASLITSIGVTLNGSSEADGDLFQIWLWNFNTAVWRQLGDDISVTNSYSRYTEWATNWGRVFGNYINGDRYFHVLLTTNTPAKDLNIDYIKLSLNTPAMPVTSSEADWWVLGAIIMVALVISALVCLHAKSIRRRRSLTEL
jgi:hypothetical protein